MDTIYTIYYVVFSGNERYLYYALRSIWWANTIPTIYYVVFSGYGYFLYYALRSVSGGRTLFILFNTQFFLGVDTIYTMHNAVF